MERGRLVPAAHELKPEGRSDSPPPPMSRRRCLSSDAVSARRDRHSSQACVAVGGSLVRKQPWMRRRVAAAGGRPAFPSWLASRSASGSCSEFVGLIAAFSGGVVEDAIMKLSDFVVFRAAPRSCWPPPPIPGVINAIIAIGAHNGPIIAKPTRDLERRACAWNTRSPRGRPDALSITCGPAPALIVQATIQFADRISCEAALSFLGLGVQPPEPSWGSMLALAGTSRPGPLVRDLPGPGHLRHRARPQLPGRRAARGAGPETEGAQLRCSWRSPTSRLT